MPSPIDPSGSPISAVTICQGSSPPSEAALLRNETRATVNKETEASWAHNFAEESSDHLLQCYKLGPSPPSIPP